MNTGRYKKQTRTTNPLVEPGYLQAWIALVSDFTSIKEPVLSATPLIGEAYTIATDHTFTTGKEPVKVYVRRDTIEAPGESNGEIGSQRMIWKPKIFIKGDGPIALEMANNYLNEEYILFVQDQCSPATFIQFGCECTPCETEKETFTSGTLTSGQKGTEMTSRSFRKFFYTGTLPERAA